jgi:hypothetical protein
VSSSSGLRRRRHLAEVEQHGDEAGGVGVDLLREVGQRRAAAQPDDRRAVAAGTWTPPPIGAAMLSNS